MEPWLLLVVGGIGGDVTSLAQDVIFDCLCMSLSVISSLAMFTILLLRNGWPRLYRRSWSSAVKYFGACFYGANSPGTRGGLCVCSLAVPWRVVTQPGLPWHLEWEPAPIRASTSRRRR